MRNTTLSLRCAWRTDRERVAQIRPNLSDERNQVFNIMPAEKELGLGLDRTWQSNHKDLTDGKDELSKQCNLRQMNSNVK